MKIKEKLPKIFFGTMGCYLFFMLLFIIKEKEINNRYMEIEKIKTLQYNDSIELPIREYNYILKKDTIMLKDGKIINKPINENEFLWRYKGKTFYVKKEKKITIKIQKK